MGGGGGGAKIDYSMYWNNYIGWLDDERSQTNNAGSKNRAKMAAAGIKPGSDLWETNMGGLDEAATERVKSIEEGFTAGELETYFKKRYDRQWRDAYKDVRDTRSMSKVVEPKPREELIAEMDPDGEVRKVLEERLGREAKIWEWEAAVEFGLPNLGNLSDEALEEKTKDEEATSRAQKAAGRKSNSAVREEVSPNLSPIKDSSTASPWI